MDPLTESAWYVEAAARGLTLQEFLATAVTKLLSGDAGPKEPKPRASAAPPVPSRTCW